MRVDVYEKFWMWLSGVLLVFFVMAILYTAAVQAVQPPSHIETINPTTLSTDPRFASPGVTVASDGSQQVVVIGLMFAFTPYEIRVTAGRPVTFRMTSPDVIHGFQIVGTNANAMVVPGYISQFTVQFDTPGEYLIVCNEFCGIGHHLMQGRLVVEAAGGEQ
jgi:cytochrome c oxidase subunit 2